jgi:hypothetical protein
MFEVLLNTLVRFDKVLSNEGLNRNDDAFDKLLNSRDNVFEAQHQLFAYPLNPYDKLLRPRICEYRT